MPLISVAPNSNTNGGLVTLHEMSPRLRCRRVRMLSAITPLESRIMDRPLDQPPYSISCAECAQGQRWVCVPAGQPLTGDEEVIRLCPEHATIVEGTPGWRRVWDEPQLPGVPLETHELMTVVACHLESESADTTIPEPLRQGLANLFRATARGVTLASMMNRSSASRYIDQRFGPTIALAEVTWRLDAGLDAGFDAGRVAFQEDGGDSDR